MYNSTLINRQVVTSCLETYICADTRGALSSAFQHGVSGCHGRGTMAYDDGPIASPRLSNETTCTRALCVIALHHQPPPLV